MSDVEEYSFSGDDDSEGSLVDFIVDDDDEIEVEDDEMEEEDESDGDDEIKGQYKPDMETIGIVTNVDGLRRSTRRNKGCPPSFYVDEDMAALMTEDIGSDIDRLSSDSDESEESESEEEYEVE